MERAHGKLGAGFPDGLCRNDANGKAFLDHFAAGKVHAIALRACPHRRLAGQGAANPDLLKAEFLQPLGCGLSNHLILGDDGVIVHHADDVVTRNTTQNAPAQRDLDGVALPHNAFRNAVQGPAVGQGDNVVLSGVGEFPGQVARVGRLEGRVGKPFPGAMRGAEVLEDAKALAEVGLDRRLNDASGRLGHQSAHSGKLPNLLKAAARAGFDHEADRVEVRPTFAGIGPQVFHHGFGHGLGSVRPGVYHQVVSFTFGNGSLFEVPFDPTDLSLGGLDNLLFLRRHDKVGGGERKAREGSVTEAEILDVIQQLDCALPTQKLVAVVDNLVQPALVERFVVVGHLRGKNIVKDDPSHRGLIQVPTGLLSALLTANLRTRGETNGDLRMDPELLFLVCKKDLLGTIELHAFTKLAGPLAGKVEDAEHDILRWGNDRFARRRREDVVGGHHERVSLNLRFDR